MQSTGKHKAKIKKSREAEFTSGNVDLILGFSHHNEMKKESENILPPCYNVILHTPVN